MGQIERENIYSINNSRLPIDTKNILKTLNDLSFIDNLSLKINKTTNFLQGNKGIEKACLYKTEEKDKSDKNKITYLDMNLKINDKSFLPAKENQESLIHKLKQTYSIREKTLTLSDSRLIVGLGVESVYETSMTLHHIYGIPYIPGQAVKGVVSNWIIFSLVEKYFNEMEDENQNQWKIWEKIIDDADLYRRYKKHKEKKGTDNNFKKEFRIIYKVKNKKNGDIPPSDNLYKYIMDENIKNDLETFWLFFGNQNRQGSIIFFDAFPASKPTIKIDIMNPHYQEYYDGKDNPPADYYNPMPLFFLTVEQCLYQFYVGAKKKNEKMLKESKIAEKTIEEWLEEALVKHGIGAKTAVGYGYFQKIKKS